jgi:hypothetical protein
MNTIERSCKGTIEQIFDLIVSTASYSVHIGGLKTERSERGWTFTLRRREHSKTGKLRASTVEGQVTIREAETEPPSVHLTCTWDTQDAKAFAEELLEVLSCHPAGEERV